MPMFQMFIMQDSNSFMMSYISTFHDHVMVVLIAVLSSVSYVFFTMIVCPCFGRFLKSSEVLEGLWTVVPCIVLACLAGPSLTTLYLSDESSNPAFSIKVIGHQWYWTYEYGEINSINSVSYDSYLVPTSELNLGQLRLLEVDKSVHVPLGVESRVMVTSSDVIHSWCIPSLGVKMDAVPGRLNQTFILPSRTGKMYGQCSEICGSMHSFMPICLEVTPLEELIPVFKTLTK